MARSLVARSLTSSMPIIRPLAAHVADERGACPSAPRSRPSRCCADRRGVRDERRPSSSLIVADAAAHDDGVAAEGAGVRAGRPVHHVGPRAAMTPSGMPEAMPLAIDRMSGSTPKCSMANILPGAAPCPTALRRRRAGCRASSSARAAAGGTRPAARRSRLRPGSARPRSAATSSGEHEVHEDLVLDPVDTRPAPRDSADMPIGGRYGFGYGAW